MKRTKLQITLAVFYGLFAVLLPLITLGIEYATHMCRDDLNYDPIPTIPHIIVVALVPIVLMFWGIQRLRAKDAAGPIWRTVLGAVASISFIYAIPMAPILPFALILTVVGLGFLPFAPVATFFVACFGMWKARKVDLGLDVDNPLQKFAKIPWGITGLIIGFGVMATLSLAEVQTQRALELTQTGTNEERAKAISNLRSLPDLAVKNAICNYRRVRGPNPLSPLQSLNLFDNMRGFDRNFTYNPELYWKITGERCEQKTWSRNARFVPQRNDRPGLSFSHSRFDGSVDARAATAYTEWNYTLKNDDTMRREADFIVQLPKDSVVSRVTLWVHGEPREATFAGRGKATAAYEAVVRKAKDPILVSEIGPDKIRVRMFPMLAGQTMRARIGITTPLRLSAEGNQFSLPKVIAGNVVHDLSHRVWMESKDEMKTPLISTTLDEKVYQTRGDISDDELENFVIFTPFFQTPSTSEKNALFATQTITTQIPEKKNLIFLVDGSVRMKSAALQLRHAFDSLDFDGNVSVLFVNDAATTTKVLMREKWSDRTREKVKKAFADFTFEGGRDNGQGLHEAQALGKNDNDIIVWLHAAQPVAYGNLLVSSRFTTPIVDFQVDGKRDVNVEALHLSGKIEGIARRGDIKLDLATYFLRFSQSNFKRNVVYGLPNDPSVEGSDWHQTSDHLFRLAARDEVDRLLLASKRDEAIQLAHENQIVTRVSAAVVLETKDQYKQNGLDQATGQGVPTIPEPEEWALMIIGAFFLLFVVWRKRRENEFSGMRLT